MLASHYKILHTTMLFLRKACRKVGLTDARMERFGSGYQRTLGQINFRNRRVLLLIVSICLFLYIMPSIWRVFFRYRRRGGPLGSDELDMSAFDVHDDSREGSGAGICLHATLSEFHRMVQDNEVALWSEKGSLHSTMDIPSVGNGYVAVTIEKAQRSVLLLKRNSQNDGVNLVTNLDILSRARVGDSLPTVAAFMMQFRLGTVKKYTYYGHAFGQCLEVEEDLVAHRVYPWLIMQSFTLRNSLPHAVEVRLENNTFAVATPLDTITNNKQHMSYFAGGSVYSTVVEKLADSYVVALAQSDVSRRFTLHPTTTENKVFTIFSVIEYASLYDDDELEDPVKSKSAPKIKTKKDVEQIRRQLEQKAQSKLQTLLKSATPSDLVRLHQSAWQLLTRSSFGISRSRATDALNGDRLNVTRYEVLSNIKFPQIEQLDGYDANIRTVQQALESTHKPISIENLDDACFSSHPTLLSTKLWTTSMNTKELLNKVKLWLLTLKKQGCDKLIAAGAYGANHAFLLSLGGLRFKSSHLEMNVQPSDLHRNMQLSRLLYDNNTYVNISVRVDEQSNKAFLYVSSEPQSRQLFACDAGCLDAPVEIGPHPVQLPVKLTEPLTAVLYVAADRAHIEELKHTLHLRQVQEADPHPHHVLAEHKHGHQLGGLPVSFWISIGLFVVLFHLFLIRILLNECAKPSISMPERRRFRPYAS